MKKSILAAAAALALTSGIGATALHSSPAQAGDDDTAAIILSFVFSGAGEWYNSGFEGGFPLVECILGKICLCVAWSSVIDAAAGQTDDGVRFDFWSSPK